MHLPPYESYPTIADDRITLREIQLSDVPEIIAISYYDGKQATCTEQAMEMQIKIQQDYVNGNTIHWAIVDHSVHKIVGTCGYYRGLDKGAGELGCILLPQFRGKGYMTAALLLAIQYGIETIGLSRIWAVTTKENTPAIKLIESIGFVKIADLEEDEVEYEWRQKV